MGLPKRKTCGDVGGKTQAGKPCSRPQSWGVEDWDDPGSVPGRCIDHREGFFLTERELRFVEEYCGEARFNQSEAARRAGYAETAAARAGSLLYKREHVRTAIALRMEELAMSAEEATVRLSEWGRGDLSPFQRLTASGEVVFDLSTKEAQDHLHLIKDIELAWVYDEGSEQLVSRIKKIRLHDAKDATKEIGRVHGIFIDRQELTGKDGGPIEVDTAALRRRLASRIAGMGERIGQNGNHRGAIGNGADRS